MLTVTSSIFTGNTGADGGGIFNYGTSIITNSTFTGNTFEVSNCGELCGGTGGISNSSGPLAIANSTFTGNRGGIFNHGSIESAVLRNTIIANSPSSGSCGGAITDGGHNLDDGTTCGFSTANGSLSNTDPQLDPAGLRSNGGPTQTIALLPTSPAIGAGDQTVCAAAPVNNLDQRGFVRPGSGHTQCSIGAYEADGTAPSSCIGDCGGTHTVAVNDIITLVDIALGTAQPSACASGVPSGADVTVAVIVQAVNNALNSCGEGQ